MSGSTYPARRFRANTPEFVPSSLLPYLCFSTLPLLASRHFQPSRIRPVPHPGMLRRFIFRHRKAMPHHVARLANRADCSRRNRLHHHVANRRRLNRPRHHTPPARLCRRLAAAESFSSRLPQYEWSPCGIPPTLPTSPAPAGISSPGFLGHSG